MFTIFEAFAHILNYGTLVASIGMVTTFLSTDATQWNKALLYCSDNRNKN